jgi:hypothetical protein
MLTYITDRRGGDGIECERGAGEDQAVADHVVPETAACPSCFRVVGVGIAGTRGLRRQRSVGRAAVASERGGSSLPVGRRLSPGRSIRRV